MRPVLLLILVAAIAGAVYLLFFSGDGGPATPVETRHERAGGASGDGEPGARLSGTPTPPPGAAPIAGAPGDGPLPSRTPHGFDMTDPAQVRERLLTVIARPDLDWSEIARLLQQLPGRLDQPVRDALLATLHRGQGSIALGAFQAVDDPTFADDLLGVIDDPASSLRARSAAATALSLLRGADQDLVVRSLESRMTGEPGADGYLLTSIARLGGREGARAMAEYLARIPDPSRISQGILFSLKVGKDPEAAEASRAAC